MSASILQDFFIQFQGDAKTLRSGLASAEKQSEKLVHSLGSVDALAAKVGHSFKETLMSIGKGAIGFFAIEGIFEKIKSVAEFADEMGKLSKVTGVNIEDLSAWSQAVKQDGGSAEEFERTVAGMSAQLADFATKGHSRAAPFFQELGIKMTDAKGKARSFIDILPELADKFSKMGKGEALGVGQRLGLDQGTINLLIKGKKEVAETIAIQKEFGVVTKHQAEVSEAFNDRMEQSGVVLRSLFLHLAEFILPIFTKLGDIFIWVNRLVKEHSTLVISTLVPALLVLSAVLLTKVVKAIKTVNWALKLAFLTNPITWLIAVFLLLLGVIGLVIEDLYDFFTGQKSLLGDLMKKYPTFAAVVRTIGKVFKEIWGAWKIFFSGAWAGIKQLGSAFMGAIRIINNALMSLAHGVMFVWEAIKKSIMLVIDSITSGIQSVEKAYNKIKSVFTGKSKVTLQTAGEHLAVAQDVPFDMVDKTLLKNNARVKNNNVNIGKVEVQTQATDSTGISKSIGNALDAQMRQAVNRFDDGIAA